MPIRRQCPTSKLTTQTSTILTIQTLTMKSIFDFVTDENKVGTYITTSLSPMPYRYSLDGCSCAGPDGKLYIFQPYDSGLIKTICYNPETNEWISKSIISVGLVNLYGLACVEASGKIYIFNNSASRSTICYDPATETWTKRAPMPTNRSDLGAATGPDGKIYVIGGLVGAYSVNTNECYDPVTDTWTTKAPMPTGRYGLARSTVTGPDGKIYVIGPYSSTNLCYDPVTDTWTTKAPMPTTRYTFAAATGPDGKIYVIGGDITVYGINVNECYDPVTDTWTKKAPMPTGRYGLNAVTGLDGKIYAIGGVDFGDILNTIECYDPIMNTWNIIWEIYKFKVTTPVVIRVPKSGSSLRNISSFMTTIRDNTVLLPSDEEYYIYIRR